MAGETLGTIRGQLILDVKQALSAYTSVRQQHVSTVTALHTGAGAMTASGAAIAGVGVAMVAGFGLAIDAAAKFEKQLDFFSAISASTQDEYDAIKEKALQLGADTIYSANEIAGSFIELGKSGVSASDIIDGVGEAVTSLAAASDIDLDTAANITLAAVQTFGLAADDALTVADKLSGAANASIIDVQDIGTSLKYAGGVARSAGIPFEDLNVAIALLGKYGIKGSTAGTSLRKMMLSLSPATEKATNEFIRIGLATLDQQKAFDFLAKEGFKPTSKSLADLTEAGDKYFQSQRGVTESTAQTRADTDKLFKSMDLLNNKFYDSKGAVKPLGEVFQVLQDSMSGMTKQQKVSSLNILFQNRALASAIALTTEGADGFDLMNAAINKTTAAEVAGKRLDNLSGDIEVLKGNIDTLLIESGGGFQEFARTLVQGLTNIIQGFLDLPKEMQTTILGITGVVGGLLILLGTFGLFAGSIMNIIALTLQLRDALVLLKGTQAAIAIATGASTAAQWALNVAMAANPIGLVVLAIAALIAIIVALIVYWEPIMQFFRDNPWAGALVPILGLVANLDKLKAAFAYLAPIVAQVWENIVKWIGEAVTNIGNFFAGIPAALFGFFIQPIIDAFNGVVGFIATVWTRIVTGITLFIAAAIAYFQALPGRIVAFFQALPGMIGYAIGFILGSIVKVFLMIGTWLATNVPIIVNNVVTFFAELPGKIASFFTDLFNRVVAWGASILAWITTNVPLIVDNVINFFKSLPSRIIAFFTALYVGAVNWFVRLRTQVTITAIQIVANIIKFIQGLPAAISKIFQDVVKNVSKFFGEAVDNVKKLAEDIYNNIKKGIEGIPDLVSDIFNNVVKAIQDAIQAAANAVFDFANGMWEGFKDGLGIHSPSYIEHALWAITDVAEEETDRLKKQVRTLQGLGNGITEVGNNLGIGFGDNMSDGLLDLYNQVKGVKDLEAEFSAGTAGSQAGVEAQRTNALLNLAEKLDAIDNLGGDTNYDIVVNNPTPEPATESIPTSIRKAAYVSN